MLYSEKKLSKQVKNEIKFVINVKYCQIHYSFYIVTGDPWFKTGSPICSASW
jgi:hypothetical protein